VAVNEIGHLILDLDHTLISSFEFGEAYSPQRRDVNTVSPIMTEKYVDEYGLPEMYHATISNINVLIKLRPNVRRFIKEAHALGFTLHVYTKGRRSYMKEILSLIDPGLELINGRLISRDDEPVHFRDSQKDLSLVFANSTGECMNVYKYVVLDDSPHVWSMSVSSGKFYKDGRVIEAKRYSFSDRFVSYLRTSGGSANRFHSSTIQYPEDSDDYLRTVIHQIAPVRADRTHSPKIAYHRTLTTTSTVTSGSTTILDEVFSSGEDSMSAWSD
jgi:TFIIF-interacting CTD phosphatase-like protein